MKIHTLDDSELPLRSIDDANKKTTSFRRGSHCPTFSVKERHVCLLVCGCAWPTPLLLYGQLFLISMEAHGSTKTYACLSTPVQLKNRTIQSYMWSLWDKFEWETQRASQAFTDQHLYIGPHSCIGFAVFGLFDRYCQESLRGVWDPPPTNQPPDHCFVVGCCWCTQFQDPSAGGKESDGARRPWNGLWMALDWSQRLLLVRPFSWISSWGPSH